MCLKKCGKKNVVKENVKRDWHIRNLKNVGKVRKLTKYSRLAIKKYGEAKKCGKKKI